VWTEIKLAENGIREVDGRWWAVIDTSIEPPDRTSIWDAVAHLEDLIESEATKSADIKVLVTAA
jgi:hypothetical protein